MAVPTANGWVINFFRLREVSAKATVEHQFINHGDFVQNDVDLTRHTGSVQLDYSKNTNRLRRGTYGILQRD